MIARLVSDHHRVQRENTALRAELEKQRRDLHALDGKLLEANQRRQDVTKRIDELIAQIDQLEAQLDAPPEDPEV